MLNMIHIRLLEYKKNWAVILIMTVMAIVFIYTFGVGFSQEYKPQVAIVDLNETPESQAIIDGLIEENSFGITVYDYDDAINKLEQNNVIAVIQIPKTYAKDAYNNDVNLELIKVGDVIEHSMLAIELQNIVSRTIGNSNFVKGVEPLFNAFNVDLNKEEMIDEINLKFYEQPSITTTNRVFESDTSASYDSLKQSFMGFIIFFSLFTVIFGIGGIVEEKEKRVWHRQKVAPIGGGKILMSSLIVGFIIGFIQIGTMLISGKYLFDIDLGGSVFALLVVVAFYIFAAMCLGLFISGLVKTEQQLSAFTPVIVVSTSMLGGCMWPLEMVGNKFIRDLSIITPQRWAMEGFREIILFNGNIGDVTGSLINLTILAIVFFALAIIPYRKVV